VQLESGMEKNCLSGLKLVKNLLNRGEPKVCLPQLNRGHTMGVNQDSNWLLSLPIRHLIPYLRMPQQPGNL
jgi:hypothetical protein